MQPLAACTWTVLVGVARPVVCARCPCATSCWPGPWLAATTRLRTPDTSDWTVDSRATSWVVWPCGAGPHLSALTAMPRSLRMPQAGRTSSWWPLAVGPMACALPLREDPEVAAAGSAGSLVTFADPALGAASAYRGAAACISSSLGRGGKAGVGTLSPHV